MHSVYLKFDGKDKELLENFRFAHDSLYGKIDTHITVVFPNEDLVPEEIIMSIEKLDGLAGTAIKLGQEIIYDGSVGYLKILDGTEYIKNIYSSLTNLLGLKSKYKYVPHVTVVRDSIIKPKRIDIGQSDFVIASIVVEEILDNGVGNIIYQQKM